MRRRPAPAERRDDGFTLVELMVACSLAIVLVGLALGVVVNTSQAVVTTRQLQSVNEEARQAVNRMARDIRQANRIVTAVNPDGPAFDPSALVAVRFQSDFDGDSCIGGVPAAGGPGSCLPYSAANPEDLTYCYEPAAGQLFVVDNQAAGVTAVTPATTTCGGGQPLLAGNVLALRIEYRSALYRFDLSPSDGVTTWREVDSATSPTSNRNGVLDVELASVDAVVLDLTLGSGGRRQAYRTQIDLRNTAR